jgi:hypothetical protein
MTSVFPTAHRVTDHTFACLISLVQASCCYHHITELEAHGVNRNDVQRLSEAGFCTVEAVSIALYHIGFARMRCLLFDVDVDIMISTHAHVAWKHYS